jgi:hypothetical protein
MGNQTTDASNEYRADGESVLKRVPLVAATNRTVRRM